ncbi:prolipoprotein diacylglyceryl transferase [Caldinitratiruptor microaerophilus]|uniref:Phosphatidylglycerol--prolipoprotein diacylglyceryl transferase n=1 Tax=Caldinitratiruptor microaerophilus TaxID=671077 RepID=A0AA35G758_9FIRM|nr:prolipoprotein diacylglyceryl transferase [Caldinitratiruptor microaerophilus]BDG62311.1 prolipoprotein diacylglyceryl transferase [Caldinitratiruptor microaerophilus]
MRPILFTIGDFPVRSYGVSIAAAALIALWIAGRIARWRGRPWAHQIEDFFLYALVAGVAGARLWEVAFSWENYRGDPAEMLALWHGGLSIQGAVLGGVLAAVWFTRTRRIDLWDFLDTVAPAAVLAQGLGRLTACVLNGDAYGRPTGTWFGIVYPPGTPAYAAFGAQPLWPAEIFEGLWDLAIFAVLVRLLDRPLPRGTVVLLYAILYSAGRFSLEFLRGDSLMIGGFKAAQLASLATIAVAGTILAVRTRQARRLTTGQSA